MSRTKEQLVDWQDWGDLSPTSVYQIIERHAEDWYEAGAMLELWRDAAVRAERERCALIAEGNYEARTFGLTRETSEAGQIAAAIRQA